MTQTPAALPEVLSLVPSIQAWLLFTACNTSSRGSDAVLWPPVTPATHAIQSDPHIDVNKNKLHKKQVDKGYTVGISNYSRSQLSI